MEEIPKPASKEDDKKDSCPSLLEIVAAAKWRCNAQIGLLKALLSDSAWPTQPLQLWSLLAPDSFEGVHL